MDYKSLRKATGMTQKSFAAYFGVGYRTVQHWDGGDRQCPDYLLDLMAYKLVHEGIIPQPDTQCTITYTPPEMETARFPVYEAPEGIR